MESALLTPDAPRTAPQTVTPNRTPSTMPDGRPWPSVSVIVLSRGGSVAAATRASVDFQRPVETELVPTTIGASRAAAIARGLKAARHAFVMILDDGDRLPEAALAMAVLAAARQGCDVLAGLRMAEDEDGQRRCDIIGLRPGSLADDALLHAPGASDGELSGGADLLIRPGRLEADSLDRIAQSRAPVTELLRELASRGGTLGTMGQVLVETRRGESFGAPGQPLRVLALNDSGLKGGGAAIAHRRLTEALELAGHTVDVAALFDSSGKATAERVDRFPAVEALVAAKRYDLVLVGNIHGATRSVELLRSLQSRAKVAVVTHDMFMLTGRCVVPMKCRQFETGCGPSCPTPDAYPELRRSRIAGAWQEKRDFLTGDPAPLLFANSDWLAAVSRDLLGPAFSDRVTKIDLPFPTQIFKPQDRAALRRSLGLPADDILIFFAAVVADEPAKGFLDIVSALRELARPGIGFVAVGRVDHPERFRLPNLITPGPIGNEDDLARWFGACDIHITASRYESLGQTPIEAGLCGTPSVAFRRTGLTTSVLHGVSGILADPKVPVSFKQAIAHLVDNQGLRQSLGAWAELTFAARNSPAAAALQMHHAMRAAGLPGLTPKGRIRFTAAMLESLRVATSPLPAATGLVAPAPGRAKRMARTLKRRLFGRSTPPWLRWLSDAVHRLRDARRPDHLRLERRSAS